MTGIQNGENTDGRIGLCVLVQVPLKDFYKTDKPVDLNFSDIIKD